jgi:putative ABC transport system permease protein
MRDFFVRSIPQAVRSLLRAPTFSVVAVLTFAIGIGGAATMFTAVSAAFLQPLAYPDADRLVMIWQTQPGNPRIPISMLNMLDWEAQNHSLAHLAAVNQGTSNVAVGAGASASSAAAAPTPGGGELGQAQHLSVAAVTAGFFPTLGVQPILGRTFNAQEASAKGGPHVAVIGYRFWQRAFGRDPNVLQRTLQIEGVPFAILGVMPRGFLYPGGAEIWEPLDAGSGGDRSAHNYEVVGRIRPGLDLAGARTDMQALNRRLAQEYPAANSGYDVALVPLREDLLGGTSKVLLLLLGAVGFVLLIACANVVNLLLARSIARQSDTILRLALGAQRGALLRPFLIESAVLALCGGLLGAAIAVASARLLAGLAPPTVLPPEALRVDGRVLLFTFTIALVVGLLCGLVPALQGARLDLRATLAAARVLGSGRRSMNALIVAEIAIAFVLLVGAGLLIRSAGRLETVDPGFSVQHVSLLRFDLGGVAGSRFDEEAWRVRFFNQLAERAAAIPGVRAVGLINEPPLLDHSYNGTLLLDGAGGAGDVGGAGGQGGLGGQGGEGGAQEHTAHYRLIAGDYLGTLGIRLVRGRAFTAEDGAGSPKVALVNQRLARELAGGADVLGRRVRIPGMDDIKDWATIVGVVADVHHRGLARRPPAEVYFPLVQRPARSFEMALLVRAEGDPGALRQRLAEVLHGLDGALPLRFEAFSGLLNADLAAPRLRARLLGAFAAVALILSAIGIFGVVSYAVSRRRREVGIRIALGASMRRVQVLIVRDGLRPVLIGIGVGAAAALLLTGLLTTLLFEIEVHDPFTYAAVAALLIFAAVVATYVPALRASEVEPSVALRSE